MCLLILCLLVGYIHVHETTTVVVRDKPRLQGSESYACLVLFSAKKEDKTTCKLYVQ